MSAPGPWRDAAPTPRGPYQPFPQAPPPPMPEHPFAGAHRRSFYAAPIPGFYSPSLAQSAPGLPLGRGGAPPFPRPELPPSLVPGRKPTYSFTRSNSDDYFFQGDSPILHSRQPQSPPVPPPPIPRKPDLSHPLLPPKPSYESSSASTSPGSPPLSYPRHHRALSYPRADAVPSAPPLPPPPPPSAHHADDDVFNHVLDISVQEVERTKEMERQRLEQARITEEAHLAMALEASLRISSPPTMPGRDRGSSFITSSPEQGPSTAPLHSPIADISLNPASEAGTRRARANSHVAQQIIDDEALALQLAQEEERLAEQERARKSDPRARSSSQLAAGGGPPQYHEAVSSPPVSSPGSLGPPVLAQPLLSTAGPSRSSSPQMPTLGRSVSDKPCPPKTVTPEKRVSRSQSLGDGIPSASTTILAPKPQTSRSISITSSSWEPTDDEDGHSPQSAPGHAPEVPSNTQYLDSELLLGLSMGFGVPTISPNPKPFAGVIPNVIALPYGKCPPFHIMAPSWRTLLKLMARLSGTRLEPTVEAMAVVKTEMRLRIVVSFVKVHHSSSEWHTVLYMTIDHPIPPSAPAGWRYRNGDTSTLPWSYTLAQQPPFLRDGADAPLSKFYTIPVNQDTPFPTLPISFPNLATYLASALENSRDAMHDSSSGLRRLAKYIDQFYPSDRAGLDDAPERSGMRQRLKNLVGIGSRPQRDRNAEMFELVTPFVPDDFGR